MCFWLCQGRCERSLDHAEQLALNKGGCPGDSEFVRDHMAQLDLSRDVDHFHRGPVNKTAAASGKRYGVEERAEGTLACCGERDHSVRRRRVVAGTGRDGPDAGKLVQ